MSLAGKKCKLTFTMLRKAQIATYTTVGSHIHPTLHRPGLSWGNQSAQYDYLKQESLRLANGVPVTRYKATNTVPPEQDYGRYIYLVGDPPLRCGSLAMALVAAGFDIRKELGREDQ